MNSFYLDSGHLIKPRALKGSIQIACVNAEGIQPARFSVGVQGNGVRLMRAEFVNKHRHRTGACMLQRHFHLEFVRLWSFPFSFNALAIFAFQRHTIDAADIHRLQMESVFAPDDQRTGVLRSDCPLAGARSPQPELWSVKRTESPTSAQHSA